MNALTRLALLDAILTGAQRLAALLARIISVAVLLPRWRPVDLYAAARCARIYAAHDLIDQAADALTTTGDTWIVTVRTWPWLGADIPLEPEEYPL